MAVFGNLYSISVFFSKSTRYKNAKEPHITALNGVVGVMRSLKCWRIVGFVIFRNNLLNKQFSLHSFNFSVAFKRMAQVILCLLPCNFSD